MLKGSKTTSNFLECRSSTRIKNTVDQTWQNFVINVVSGKVCLKEVTDCLMRKNHSSTKYESIQTMIGPREK